MGPRVVPLGRPCVVVDKVHSAIVLALLCGNKHNIKNRGKKGFTAFNVDGQLIKKNQTHPRIWKRFYQNTREVRGVGCLWVGGGGGMSHPGGGKQEGLCDISLWFVQPGARVCVCVCWHPSKHVVQMLNMDTRFSF